MSAAPETLGDDAATPPVEDHDCASAPARVTVRDTRIPVINDGLRTEMRKDGAMDITTHSEVYFPAEWNDERYELTVEALDPDAANVYDPVDIEVRDELTGTYQLLHRGFIMGVGGGTRGSLERRMTVGDVGQLLGAIPFDEQYDFDATLGDIVEDVIAKLRARIVPEIFSSLAVTDTSALDAVVEEPGFEDREERDILPTVIPIVDGLRALYDQTVGTSIEFIGNEDTAADALDTVSERLADDAILYFAPDDGDGMQLVIDTRGDGYNEDRVQFAQHVPQRPNDVRVLRNNALHEIRPINTLTVEGRVQEGTYPQASAIHKPLRERAGMTLEEMEGPIDATSIGESKDIATTRLKERIDGAGLGELAMKPATQIRPYAFVVAQPACGTEVSDRSDPLTFEVESVVHRIAAKADERDGKRLHETQARVSMAVREEDIVTPNNQAGYVNTDASTLLDDLIVGPDRPSDSAYDDVPISRYNDQSTA